MRISLFNLSALAASVVSLSLPLQSSFADSGSGPAGSEAARIALLEQRLLQLEQRLADTEQETKEVKVLAANTVASSGAGNVANSSVLGNGATFDILAGSAWRNLRWTQEEQWAGIKRGVTEEKVIELLGYPPRSLDSLKPRVDKVYWYETSLRDTSTGMHGKISFKKGRVVAVEKPDFSASPVVDKAAVSRQRLP
ncbi:hypothetical protein QEH52_05875 [Coraliomargarita sp. SDUM461003]|uniref:Lipoprotein SmpA/OmlA domain-containing protein n=1 Tax=Thalassobacterium maritimum TaxID=3041265 RepID=A0ABU1AS89_9BACT|nr:hypothetical protein [Coraliomargarita sp. SDUM461003]MDQ8207026.1 hypothetical protein [Coraliomargarita sp. SDUM461003]